MTSAAGGHVLPPIRTFTVGPGVPPGQPLVLADLRVADCHRRFGITPTPEHVLCADAGTDGGSETSASVWWSSRAGQWPPSSTRWSGRAASTLATARPR